MKKVLLFSILFVVIGCYSAPNKIFIEPIAIPADAGSAFQSELVQIKNQIEVKTSYVEKAISAAQTVKSTFGCTSEPKEPNGVIKETPLPPPVAEPKPTPVPERWRLAVDTKLKPVTVQKSAILGVKTDWELKDGRMMFTKWKVKLNKAAIEKVKIGAKVRIFIDYCYYESNQLDKDGNVIFDIDWHPPMNPVKGKVGVSLFFQFNTPEIGSGVTYCSTVVRV